MTAEQEEKLDKIHELLAGTLKEKGLVHKVNEMNEKVEDLEKYKVKDQKLKWGVIGGLAVLQGVWHWLTSK